MSRITINDLLVMLVEPSSTQRRIIQQCLHNLGVERQIAVEDGATALTEMHTYTPDLVISSLYLPDMSGTDLVHTMREDPQLHDMAFMLISSETRFRYLDPIRQAGAVAILPKPFDETDLRMAMTSTLDFLAPLGMEDDAFDPESMHVLVVDDSSLARKHIRRILTSLGFERFTEAEDGEAAVSLIANNYFDLVVTDYNMPHMDGKELVDHIRNASSQSSVPVMMVTSEENENRLAAVQQAGVSAICDKPFEPETVRNLVQRLLSN